MKKQVDKEGLLINSIICSRLDLAQERISIHEVMTLKNFKARRRRRGRRKRGEEEKKKEERRGSLRNTRTD